MVKDDPAIVEAQIGRPLRAESRVVSRCGLGLPVVVEVPPLLESGEPFPTRWWLTCPLAHRRIARLEAAGEVRAFDRRRREDPDFAAAMEATHARYAAERDELVPDDARLRPRGGVAGSRGGVKCLHAHFADQRAIAAGATEGSNPVGAETAAAVEPLNCAFPCVTERDGVAVRSPEWVEPELPES
ncbi:MAG: hypothetical protein CMN30_05610 [Sandaracinus sp.]|nr:hypothetical protein [Sandaracinus sp.]